MHRLLPLMAQASAATTTLIYDTFTDANGTSLALHTIAPTNTPATSWTNNSTPNLTVVSNKAKSVSGESPRYTLDAGIANGTITCDIACIAAASVYASVIFRFQNTNNYWYSLQAISEQTVYIVERNAGGDTTRASSSTTITQNVEYTHSIVLSGNSIAVTIGSTNLTYSSSFLASQTRHGLASYNTTTWDNFKVTQ